MEKLSCGLGAIMILAGLQVVAWYLNIDGITTASLLSLIGLIGGSIFGFTIAKKELEKQEEK